MPLKPVRIEYPLEVPIFCQTNKRWEQKTFATQNEWENFLLSRVPEDTHISAMSAYDLGLSDLPPCSC